MKAQTKTGFEREIEIIMKRTITLLSMLLVADKVASAYGGAGSIKTMAG